MGAKPKTFAGSTRLAAAAVLALSCVLMAGTVASAQGARPPGAPQEESFFGGVGRWFDEQFDKLSSGFKDAQKSVETFGREAGVAAKSTAEGAKDAADAVARLPATRPVSGHEVCRVAPNGAPDCVAAANKLCKGKGFASGKSLDMTTAEICPPRAFVSRDNPNMGCKTETFVSRALCQ